MKRQIKEIEINRIDLDTSQPRQVIEEDKLKDLAEDMKEAGQLVPIILTPCYKKGETLVVGKMASTNKDFRWFVLDGYRRILAMKLNKKTKIDAEIRYELGELDCYEVQFRANAKRVQVTVKEMAKAIQRYAEVWKKEGKRGDIVGRLSKITGYSTTYFDMANDIVKEEKDIKNLIYLDKVGAYYSAEKKRVSKNKDIKDGMDEAVKEYIARNPTKRVGALTPRVLKPEFIRIEKRVKDNKTKKKIAKAKTLEYLNRSLDIEDEKANFEKYLYETEEFYEKILKWNVRGLTQTQVDKITEILMKSVTYLKEEKRKNNKMPKGKGKKTKNL